MKARRERRQRVPAGGTGYRLGNWESSGGIRFRSFSNIVCRFTPYEGRWECRMAVERHDIFAVQSQPESSNGLPAKSR